MTDFGFLRYSVILSGSCRWLMLCAVLSYSFALPGDAYSLNSAEPQMFLDGLDDCLIPCAPQNESGFDAWKVEHVVRSACESCSPLKRYVTTPETDRCFSHAALKECFRPEGRIAKHAGHNWSGVFFQAISGKPTGMNSATRVFGEASDA